MRVRRPSSRTVLFVGTVAASLAAALPAPARADDDSVGASPPATESVPAVVDLATALVDDATETVEEATEGMDAVIAPTPEGGGAVPEDGTAEVPEQVPDSDPTAPAPVTDTAPTGVLPSDTTDDGGDTAPDSTAPTTGGGAAASTPPSPAATASPAAAPTVRAVNVNVSVRIGSAGDNAAVSQSNASTTPGPSSSTALPASTTSASAATGVPRDSTSTPWYWAWDCRDLPVLPVVSPDDSPGGSIPTSWTWIWNCVDNPDRYQAGTGEQYQQSNTNISIRISSPGDDGRVTQTNIALPAVVPGGASPAVIALPTITVTAPAIGGAIASAAIPVIAGISVIDIAVPAVVPAAVLNPEAATEWALETLDVAVANEARPASPASFETPGGWPFVVAGRVSAIRTGRGSPPLPAGLATSPADVAVTPAGSSTHSRSGAHREPRKARPAPRWSPVEIAADPKAPASGTSASAAAVGGSPSGGLPIFLALPFIAAALELARRVVLERTTWPSGHRRRVPDTPG